MTVYAPASTSNLGPGFDTLGLAVDLYLRVELDRDDEERFEVRVTGEGKGILPEDGRNRIVTSAREIAGDAVDSVRWHVHSEIPVARGLGSSAAARAAGLAAGHLLASGDLPDGAELFDGVVRTENHPDNAAATVFGGFRISGKASDGGWESEPGRFDAGAVRMLFVIPEVPVSTQEARSILPTTYSRASVVRNLQNLAALLAGLASGNWEAVHRGCRDQVHEPFRLPLVAGLGAALDALRDDPRCGGAFLSGAGPTLGAFVPDPSSDIDGLGRDAVSILASEGSAANYRVARVETRGIRWNRT